MSNLGCEKPTQTQRTEDVSRAVENQEITQFSQYHFVKFDVICGYV